jgi:hypothetical protein
LLGISIPILRSQFSTVCVFVCLLSRSIDDEELEQSRGRSAAAFRSNNFAPGGEE